jgi:hypothetical protein
MAEVADVQDTTAADPTAPPDAGALLGGAGVDAALHGALLGGASAEAALYGAPIGGVAADLHGAVMAPGAGLTTPTMRGLPPHGVGAAAALHAAVLATTTAQAARNEDFPLGIPPWTPTGAAGAQNIGQAPQGTGAGGAEAHTATTPFPALPPLPPNMAQSASTRAAAIVAARAAAVEGQTRVRAAALIWERERASADALARQLAEAEQLLGLSTSTDA